MKRWHFLKRLLGGGLGLAVAPAMVAKPARRTPVYAASVRGFQYHEGPGYLKHMQVGDALELRREPHNSHDPSAMAVYWNQHHIGYLPRTENVSLAIMLDQGLQLEARITSLDPDAPAWDICAVEVELVSEGG